MNDSGAFALCDAQGNLITSIADGAARRLQVDTRSSNITGSSLINRQVATTTGATSMIVSGTLAAPVSFFYSPPTGKTATITRINILIVATTIAFDGAKFLNGLAMPNGIGIGSLISGVTTISTTLKQNEDFLLYSLGGGFSGGNVGGLLTTGTNSILTFSLALAQPLTQMSGDQVVIQVRDNLTSTGGNMLYCRGSVQGFLSS